MAFPTLAPHLWPRGNLFHFFSVEIPFRRTGNRKRTDSCTFSALSYSKINILMKEKMGNKLIFQMKMDPSRMSLIGISKSIKSTFPSLLGSIKTVNHLNTPPSFPPPAPPLPPLSSICYLDTSLFLLELVSLFRCR